MLKPSPSRTSLRVSLETICFHARVSTRNSTPFSASQDLVLHPQRKGVLRAPMSSRPSEPALKAPSAHRPPIPRTNASKTTHLNRDESTVLLTPSHLPLSHPPSPPSISVNPPSPWSRAVRTHGGLPDMLDVLSRTQSLVASRVGAAMEKGIGLVWRGDLADEGSAAGGVDEGFGMSTRDLECRRRVEGISNGWR